MVKNRLGRGLLMRRRLSCRRHAEPVGQEGWRGCPSLAVIDQIILAQTRNGLGARQLCFRWADFGAEHVTADAAQSINTSAAWLRCVELGRAGHERSFGRGRYAGDGHGGRRHRNLQAVDECLHCIGYLLISCRLFLVLRVLVFRCRMG